MPNTYELRQVNTHLTETEKVIEDAPVFQSGSHRLPDERGGPSAGSYNDTLFSFLHESHLQEAREFRRKGFNSQIPEVDPAHLTALRAVLADARTHLSLHTSVDGPLDSRWLLQQITQIERLTGHLSVDSMRNWVKHEVPRQRSGDTSGEDKLGSRRQAQSLVRRLESTLQTLLRIVHSLRAIDDHRTPEKREALLVTELVSAFSVCDEMSVRQALQHMTSEPAWASLVQTRDAAWETDKAEVISTMNETTRHEAQKANKKARVLPGNSASQAFFSAVATYFQSLSGDLTYALGTTSQSTTSPVMGYVNSDTVVALPSRSAPLLQRLTAFVDKEKLKLPILGAELEGKLHQLTRVIRQGHSTKTPSNNTEQVVADSVIRSILWQWQQPAIQVQYASGAILSKVKELKKIEGMFASDVVTYDKGSQREGEEMLVSHPGEDELDVQVRQWVHERIEQATPENQQAEKLAVLNKLLDSDIDHARGVVGRLREKAESMESLLRKQRFAVLKMIPLSGLDSSLREVDKLLREVASNLSASLAVLENACEAAAMRDFAEAEKQANNAQLRATTVKESLSADSARLTERPLNEHSRGSRLAKHWANIAKEYNLSNEPNVGVEQVYSSLKKQALLDGVISIGDPEGYLFATRLAGELENIRHDELRLPMSPEQYAALERGLVEYIVKWGGNRLSRGIARIIIELSFEQGLDAVSFSVSSLFRVPFKVLKASIKVPYNVHKVNNYTMPGHDKPYKAIYGMLEKKLKQLGFNIVTAPVPGIIKLVAGAGITASAAVYNAHVGHREKAFGAVYQRLTEGKKSEKIKMESVGGMIVDSVMDGATSAGFKGTHIAWKAGESENRVIQDESFLDEDIDTIDERISPRAPWDQMEYEAECSVWEHVVENQSDAESLSDVMSLQQQTDVELLSDENDQASEQPGVRRKRAVASAPSGTAREVDPPIYRKWHNNIPVDASIQSEHFDFDSGIRYQDLSPLKKQYSYQHAIGFVLHQIENDNHLPPELRNRAYLARMGAKTLVPVDIKECKLNNTLLLTDSDGAKTGVLICLDSETPYYLIRQGRDLPASLVSVMPYNADNAFSRINFSPLGISNRINAIDVLNHIRAGRIDLEGRFNCNNPQLMDIASLSAQLAKTIEDDYQRKGKTITNKLLISRAIAGAHAPGAAARITLESQEIYHSDITMIDFSLGLLSNRYLRKFLDSIIDNNPTEIRVAAAEYLRSIERPFATLSGDMQSVISSYRGETVQEANRHIHEAEYIGSWIDVTASTVASLTPVGFALNIMQSAAGLGADALEGKELDPMAIANLVIGCIPEGKLVAKIGKFSRIGGRAVKYGLMVGNKALDLAIAGESIKTAVKTGDPLAIYQALLASGMSARSSYHMAKNMSSKLGIRKKMEESASLEQLEAIHNNTPESILPSTMTVRKFRLGSTELLGRINSGELEISSNNGVDWGKGSTLHLLAYRLQNAGGKNTLPVEEDRWLPAGEGYWFPRGDEAAASEDNLRSAEHASSEEMVGEYPTRSMPSVSQYEPHKFGDEKNYSIDLTGASELRAKMRSDMSDKGTRVQRFNEGTNSYDNVNDYDVVPYQPLFQKTNFDKTPVEYVVGLLALQDMFVQYDSLEEIAAGYTGSRAADLQESLRAGKLLVERMIFDLSHRPNPENLHFFLVEKSAEPVTTDKVLGICKIVDRQPGEKGSIILESAVVHPYIHISKNTDFIRYAASRGWEISPEDRARYNIKRVGTKLVHDGLKQTMQKIDKEVQGNGRLSRPESIQFSARNPIMARMAKKFNARRTLVNDTEAAKLDGFIQQHYREKSRAPSPFAVGGKMYLGRRQGGIFQISVDNGKTWKPSENILFQTAWRLQNAGGKRQGWNSAVMPHGVDHPRHQPIPGTVGRKSYGKSVPGGLARKDLTEVGEWPGAVGMMPGGDDVFFEHVARKSGPVDMENINSELLGLMREREFNVRSNPFEFRGKTLRGRVNEGIFETSMDEGLTWSKGNVLKELAYRTQTTNLLQFGVNYFNALREADPLRRVSKVARKVARDNRIDAAQPTLKVKDPLALYGGGESWDSVLKLESKCGLMTKEEYKAVKKVVRGDSRAFVGGNARNLTRVEELQSIPAGYRIALLDDTGTKLVHGMLSGGNGRAYSSKNYVLGGHEYWSEINLADTFNFVDGRFYIKSDTTPFGIKAYKIAVDYYAAPAQHAAVRLPARPVQENVLGVGTIGTVSLRKDGRVEKIFSVPFSDENNSRLVSARNNAEGFNRYYGDGSAEVVKDAIPGTTPLQYQAKNIMRRVEGMSLDTIDDINVFRLMKENVKIQNPIDSLTRKLKEKGIFHNDINAGNIMYDEKTGTFDLIDFDSATYTMRQDGVIQPLSNAQTEVMRSKLIYVFGDNSMSELMKRKGITSGWHELSYDSRLMAERNMVEKFSVSGCNVGFSNRKKRSPCGFVPMRRIFNKGSLDEFINHDSPFKMVKNNLQMTLEDKFDLGKVRSLLSEYSLFAKSNDAYKNMTYEKLEVILKEDLTLSPTQEQYMTLRGWKRSFVDEVDSTLPTNYWSKAYAEKIKTPKVNAPFDSVTEQDMQISIYRTMGVEEADSILRGDFIDLNGHLGDLKQAATYYHQSQDESNAQVILKFTLKPGAHVQLFSPDTIAIQTSGKGAGWLHGVISARHPGRMIQKASSGEGLLPNYIGVKSEKHGEGFSFGMGEKGANRLGKEKFSKLLERVDVVIGPEKYRGGSWHVSEVPLSEVSRNLSVIGEP